MHKKETEREREMLGNVVKERGGFPSSVYYLAVP